MFWLSFEASKTARPEEKNTAPIPTENHMFGPLFRIENFGLYDLMEIAMYTICILPCICYYTQRNIGIFVIICHFNFFFQECGTQGHSLYEGGAMGSHFQNRSATGLYLEEVSMCGKILRKRQCTYASRHLSKGKK